MSARMIKLGDQGRFVREIEISVEGYEFQVRYKYHNHFGVMLIEIVKMEKENAADEQ